MDVLLALLYTVWLVTVCKHKQLYVCKNEHAYYANLDSSIRIHNVQCTWHCEKVYRGKLHIRIWLLLYVGVNVFLVRWALSEKQYVTHAIVFKISEIMT
jgi:hypothetical protein